MIRSSDFYKIGIVVADLDAAVARSRMMSDLQWAAVPSGSFPVRMVDGIREVTLPAAISRQTPRVHLIQEAPGTPWVVALNSSAHHLAYWVDDVGKAGRDLGPVGFSFECGEACENPELASWAMYVDQSGSRIELLRRRTSLQDFERFIDELPEFGRGEENHRERTRGRRTP